MSKKLNHILNYMLFRFIMAGIDERYASICFLKRMKSDIAGDKSISIEIDRNSKKVGSASATNSHTPDLT